MKGVARLPKSHALRKAEPGVEVTLRPIGVIPTPEEKQT